MTDCEHIVQKYDGHDSVWICLECGAAELALEDPWADFLDFGADDPGELTRSFRKEGLLE